MVQQMQKGPVAVLVGFRKIGKLLNPSKYLSEKYERL